MLFFLFICCVVCSLSGEKENENIFDLSPTFFDDFISKQNAVVVQFSSDWCSFCKYFQPKFEETAAMMKGQLTFGQVDCSYEELCIRNEVVVLPTVMLFVKDSEPVQYIGSHSVHDFSQFLIKKLHPPMSVISDEQIKLKTKTENFVLITATAQDAKAVAQFKELVDQNKYINFYLRKGKEFTVSVVADGETFTFEESNSIDLVKLDRFIFDHAVPHIVDADNDYLQKLTEMGVQSVIYFYDGHITAEEEFFLRVQSTKYPFIYFVKFNHQLDVEQAKSLNVTTEEFPAIVAVHWGHRTIVPLDGTITFENFEEMVNEAEKQNNDAVKVSGTGQRVDL